MIDRMSISIAHQSINYSLVKLKQYLKGNKAKFGLGIFFISIILLMYGLILLVLYEGMKYNTITTTTPVYSQFRTYFSNFILASFLTILCYSIFTSAIGYSNPFINSRMDLQFQILIPIDPFVSFFSTKIYNFSRNLLICTMITLFMFGPLMLGLNRTTASFRIAFVILLFAIGSEIVSEIGNIFFFIFRRLRYGKNWAITSVEQPIFTIIILAIIPVVFLQLLDAQSFPSYNTLSNFIYVPLVSTAIGSVGFFFRSGIPLNSYLSIVISLTQLVILFFINIVLIKINFSSSELGDLLSVLDYLDNQQKEMIFAFMNNLPTTLDEVEENYDFYSTKAEFSLIKKEWLLIKRSNELKINFLVICVLSLLTVGLSFVKVSFSQNPDVLSIAFYVFTFMIALEIGSLATLYHSISLNYEILALSRIKNVLEKFFYSLLYLIPLAPLLILKTSLILIILVIVLIIISEILNRIQVISTMVSFFIGMILSFIFVPFIFLY